MLHFSGGHEADGIPVPLVVDNAVVEVDRPVGGDEVVREDPLTSGWNGQLLGTLLEVHFGSLSVPALDDDSGVPGQVGYEVSLPELVDSLLDGHDLKGVQHTLMPNSANLSGTSLGPTLIRSALASPKAQCTKKLEALQFSHKALNAKLENTAGNQENKD